MNVLYLDSSDITLESYSLEPDRYGGAGIVGRSLKEQLNDSSNTFHIYANPECFTDLKSIDRKNCCFPLNNDERSRLRNGEQIKNVISKADNYDILCHHNSTLHINTSGTKLKTAVWPVGSLENIHPLNEHLLFFNIKHQQPRFQHNNHKIYNVIIANDIPEFQEYQKENFLFFCSRQTEVMGSSSLIRMCLKNNIPLILGGRIDKGYEWINSFSISNPNNNTCVKFLGELNYHDKIEYTKKARAVPILHTWISAFSLLGTEAQFYGCPLIVTNIGWWRDFIFPGKNGYIIGSEEEFVSAYNVSKNIKQIDCYESAQYYNSNRMCEMFLKAFEDILNN